MSKYIKFLGKIVASFCLLQACFPIFDIGFSFLDMFDSLKKANNRELICQKDLRSNMNCTLKEISLSKKLLRKETFRLLRVEERKSFVTHCFLRDKWCLDELHESVYLMSDQYSISFYDEVLQKQNFIHRLQMTSKLKNFVENSEIRFLEMKEDGSFKASLFFLHFFLFLFWIALSIGLFSDDITGWFGGHSR